MIHLTWTIGDVTITRIPEILADLPPTGLLPEATPEALEPYREWLEPHFLRSDGQIPLSIHGLLVDTGGLRILVDTCVGPHTVPGYEAISEGAEDFLAGLADAGCAPDAVDVVTSQGERAFITGDMTHHPVQWAQPDWQMLSDSDSAVATATRKRVADSLLDTSVLVIGTHYAAPCAGHLVRGDRGVWFRALA